MLKKYQYDLPSLLPSYLSNKGGHWKPWMEDLGWLQSVLLTVIVNKDGETVICLSFLVVVYLGVCHLLLS